MARQSLSSMGAKPAAKPASGMDADTKKKAVMGGVAIIVVLAVGAWLYYYFVVAPNQVPKGPPVDITAGMSETEKAQFEKERKKREDLDKRIPPSGS